MLADANASGVVCRARRKVLRDEPPDELVVLPRSGACMYREYLTVLVSTGDEHTHQVQQAKKLLAACNAVERSREGYCLKLPRRVVDFVRDGDGWPRLA